MLADGGSRYQSKLFNPEFLREQEPAGAVVAGDVKALPAARNVYRLLEPGPVVLLATARNGRANVMAMSWHMMVDFEPPLIGCVVSSANHGFAGIMRATRERVIAVPAVELADKKVVGVGNCSGRDVDEFAELGLTRVPAEQVAPPLIGECFANLECRVTETRLVNRFNLFVVEVVKAWPIPRRNTPGPSTITATANSSSMARRSN